MGILPKDHFPPAVEYSMIKSLIDAKQDDDVKQWMDIHPLFLSKDHLQGAWLQYVLFYLVEKEPRSERLRSWIEDPGTQSLTQWHPEWLKEVMVRRAFYYTWDDIEWWLALEHETHRKDIRDQIKKGWAHLAPMIQKNHASHFDDFKIFFNERKIIHPHCIEAFLNEAFNHPTPEALNQEDHPFWSWRNGWIHHIEKWIKEGKMKEYSSWKCIKRIEFKKKVWEKVFFLNRYEFEENSPQGWNSWPSPWKFSMEEQKNWSKLALQHSQAGYHTQQSQMLMKKFNLSPLDAQVPTNTWFMAIWSHQMKWLRWMMFELDSWTFLAQEDRMHFYRLAEKNRQGRLEEWKHLLYEFESWNEQKILKLQLISPSKKSSDEGSDDGKVRRL